MATWLEQEAVRLVGVPGWVPFEYELIANGVLCTGAVCPLVTRGPRKGLPNYRKLDRSTIAKVAVARAK